MVLPSSEPIIESGISPFSTAWNVSNESFMQDVLISMLKLRLGYGLTGNQNIDMHLPIS